MASLFRRGEHWWISFYVAGQRRREPLNTTDERIARQRLRKVEYEQATGGLELPSSTPIVPFLDAFCEYLQTTRRQKSYHNDLSRLRTLFGPICEVLKPRGRAAKRSGFGKQTPVKERLIDRLIRVNTLEELTAGVIEAHFTKRVKLDGIGPKTINLLREVLHVMFNYAIRQHGFRSPDRRYPNPVDAVPRRKESDPQIRFLTLEQIQEQLDALSANMNDHDANLWNYENGRLGFGTNNTLRMVITNTGNVTVIGGGNDRVQLRGNVNNGGSVLVKGTDGDNNMSLVAEDIANPDHARVDIYGRVFITGDLDVSGSKDFTIDHPLDPEHKYLVHACLESDERKNVYDGMATLDCDGRAVVCLAEWTEKVGRDWRYQLTALGTPMPSLHVAEEMHGGRFTIAGGAPGGRVCWQVAGIRCDPYAVAHPFMVEREKCDGERGRYLFPEGYGHEDEKRIRPGPSSDE